MFLGKDTVATAVANAKEMGDRLATARRGVHVMTLTKCVLEKTKNQDKYMVVIEARIDANTKPILQRYVILYTDKDKKQEESMERQLSQFIGLMLSAFDYETVDKENAELFMAQYKPLIGRQFKGAVYHEERLWLKEAGNELVRFVEARIRYGGSVDKELGFEFDKSLLALSTEDELQWQKHTGKKTSGPGTQTYAGTNTYHAQVGGPAATTNDHGQPNTPAPSQGPVHEPVKTATPPTHTVELGEDPFK